MASAVEKDTKKRLIVLLPISMVNDTGLSYIIHWEASRQNCDVYYLTIDISSDEILAISRGMTTMKAITASNYLKAHWIDAGSTDWVSEIQAIYRPGDMVICLQGHTVSTSTARIPISDYLKESLNIQAQSISGFSADIEEHKHSGIPEIVRLIGFLAIVALFSWCQYRIDLSLDGFSQNLVILLSFCFELGFIWLWFNFKEA